MWELLRAFGETKSLSRSAGEAFWIDRKPGHLNVVGYRSKSKMEAGRKEEQKRAGCAEANKEQVLLMGL